MKSSPESCRRVSPLWGAVFLVVLTGCPRQPQVSYPDPQEYRFAGRDPGNCGEIPGFMDWEHLAYDGYGELSDEVKKGACTWYFWPGGDAVHGRGANAEGNPRFWRKAELRTGEAARKSGLPVGVNLLAFLDSRGRGQRFARLGTINDPGCQEATSPDPFGLWLDECQDPYSSGVLGIRLFPNPYFNPRKWDPEAYLHQDARIEPPYRAGLTCGVCHIAFNPANPPEDPENPRWENLAPALGNQYLREGEMFKAGLTEEDFLYWIFDTQQPGTSDTSRISTDFINNPNAINSIFYLLSSRPSHPEVMNDGTTRTVPRILKDGSDSIGPAGAALRVYVNIGTCGDYRMSLEDSFVGLKPQRPFDLIRAETECQDWQKTAALMDAAATFLDSVRPYDLKDAPGGTRYLTASQEDLRLGRRVFAQHCARCHSSKLPPGYTHEGPEKHSPEATADWVRLVMEEDFLPGNFLSDDQRYPLVSDDPRFAIGTNAARALATNARYGHLWEQFSSRTYKELPSPGTLILANPFDPGDPIEFQIPAGGNGYYRTPSLVNLWATAPFFHNNSLGLYNHDPSVAGRMAAFQDAAEKLLWPERRLGEGSIKVTPRESYLRIRFLEVRVPEGTPVNLLANIHLQRLLETSALLERFKEWFHDPQRLVRLVRILKEKGEVDEDLKALVPELLRLNQAPDFIEDHGHTFGQSLSDQEKLALIEFMKTF